MRVLSCVTYSYLYVRREFKHPFMDMKAWKRLLHNGKSSGNPLNFGTPCLRLQYSLAPTFALAPSASFSLLAASKSPGVAELLPMLTPRTEQSPSCRVPALVVLASIMSWNRCSCPLISASIISVIRSSCVGGIAPCSPSQLDVVGPRQTPAL